MDLERYYEMISFWSGWIFLFEEVFIRNKGHSNVHSSTCKDLLGACCTEIISWGCQRFWQVFKISVCTERSEIRSEFFGAVVERAPKIPERGAILLHRSVLFWSAERSSLRHAGAKCTPDKTGAVQTLFNIDSDLCSNFLFSQLPIYLLTCFFITIICNLNLTLGGFVKFK